MFINPFFFQGAENVDHTVIDPTNGDVEAWLSSTARRRVSTATTICVFITALLVMSIGIIGGVYLYRQFSRHQVSENQYCNCEFEVLMNVRYVVYFIG